MVEDATDREAEETATADRLHSAAIHLLRRVRQQDSESGLSPARLSALSVIVFGGPVTMGELAEAERVQLPTISRLVTGLEHEGLVVREADASDRRVVRVRATEKGKRLSLTGRRRRVGEVAAMLETLPEDEFECLSEASRILQHLLGERHREEE